MICKSLHFVFVYIYICLFSSVFFKAAKITNEMDSNLKNNILILQNIGRYINNASPKKKNTYTECTTRTETMTRLKT